MRLVSAVLLGGLLPAALPLTGSAQVAPGHVAWHDLITPDLDSSKLFYGQLFGWTWRAPTSGKGVTYVVAERAGVAMGGIALSADKASGSQWITYFMVHDVPVSVQAAQDSGARVIVPAKKTGSWDDDTALLTDPQGAAFGLMKPGHEPESVEAATTDWLWVDLWTTDVAAATAFYGGLFGYELRAEQVAGKTTNVFLRDSMPVAGMLQIPVKGVRPNWLPTVRVDDVAAMVSRAVELGARVIMAPRADVQKGTVAIIADPTGAALTLQEWNAPAAEMGTR